jgi:hypothetical protein
MKLPTFYTAQRFIIVFTRAHHLSQSWIRRAQTTPSHSISLRYTLMFFLQLHVIKIFQLVSSVHVFRLKCCIAFLISSMSTTCPPPILYPTFDFYFCLDSPIWAWAFSFRRGFMIAHTLDTPHSVGLLWTSDQLVAETST